MSDKHPFTEQVERMELLMCLSEAVYDFSVLCSLFEQDLADIDEIEQARAEVVRAFLVASNIPYGPIREELPSEPLLLSVAPKPRLYRKGTIPAELRWEVLERDNFTCQRCGTRRHLHADHVLPESKGGPTTLENLQTLCRICNLKKGVTL